jgi:L-alanine-DL-glutamate epimerase-like enolase superfamily enzyme
VPIYASGIHPDMLDEMVNVQRAAGYRSYKLKVGFGLKKDIAAVRQLKDMLRDGERMMLDANQAWDISKAGEIIPHFAEYAPDWLEEPLAADCPWDEWFSLSRISAIPIAAGENLRGHVDFGAAVDCGALRVIQPDMCKWGGFSGCYAVANRIVQSGLVYCPHYLGAGIGLMASAQLLAAVGGSGRLEIDSNANPLRELLARPLPRVSDGFMTLPDAAGLGVEPDLDAAREWLAYSTVAA